LPAAPGWGKKTGLVADIAAWKLRPASLTAPANHAVSGVEPFQEAIRDR